jgi:hypothetical protein
MCLDEIWWCPGQRETFSIQGKLFGAFGLSTLDLYKEAGVIFANSKLINDYGLDNPAQAVLDGTWTLDKMLTNMEGAYIDLDGNQKMDLNDCYGLNYELGTIVSMMVHFDSPYVIVNEEGLPEFAYTNHSEKMVNTFDTIFTHLVDSPNVLISERDGNSYEGYRQMFANNQFMYTDTAIGHLESYRDLMEDGFGVIPYPKLTEEQENYISNGSMWASTYALPTSCADPEQAGAILDVMGYYSVDTITKEVIQQSVMVRNTRDEESEEMLRISFADRTYDIGYTLNMGGVFADDAIYNIVYTRTNTFVSKMEACQKKFENDVQQLIDIYFGTGTN